MTWVADENQQRNIGPYSLVSERDGDQTAHLVTFPDNRQLRVLPDGSTSGQKRSRVTKVTLEALAALVAHSESLPDGETPLPPGYDPMLYLVGSLAYGGLSWEQVSNEQTVEDVVADWIVTVVPVLDEFGVDGETAAKGLVSDLASSGWKIVKTE